MKIAFIGGGNMATALIGGLLSPANSTHTIRVVDPGPGVKERLERQWPVNCFTQASAAIKGMDAVVLAVKPQVLPVVLQQISQLLSPGQLVISIVAGIPISQILAQLDGSPPVIRTMPNTPALIGLGMTGLYAQENCSIEQRDCAQQLMQAAGEVVWLEDENLLDVVTAVSGSGPAYIYYLTEAMRNAGTRLGLPVEVATKLALQTAYGASTMAVQSDMDLEELRRRVTSKGGTTQAALEKLEAGGFESLVYSAIQAATQRGQELGTPT